MKLVTAEGGAPRDGEQVSGDAVLVRHADGGRVLLALIDALGHGPEAHAVAVRACAILSSAVLDRGLPPLVDAVAAGLVGTRGAAGMVCLIEGGRLHGCGVGNVQLRTTVGVPVVLSEGVLGGRIRKLRFFEGALRSRGRLVLWSDGLATRVASDALADATAAAAAARLMNDYRYRHDDASVLVADWEPAV